jgi:ATP-dependent protease ClpP protease subunit
MDISIEGEIGWDVTEADITQKLQGITDLEELNIKINSPGGSIYQGIAIFNLIREHSKRRPVNVKVCALAASMGSYIALAARTVNPTAKVTVSDNSVFVIHNPWMLIIGDHIEARKKADYLQRLAAMFCATYAAISGNPKNDIQAAMNTETYYVGREITEAGFANDFEVITQDEGETEPERDSLLVNARMCIDTAKKKAREREQPDDYEKAVALLQNSIGGEKQPPANENKTQPDGAEPAGKEGKMTPDELKAKYPDCFAAVMALGEAAALAKEKERIAAHIKLGRQAGSLETAAKFIEDGKSVMSEEVQSEYLSLRMGKKAVDDRNGDNPPPINTGGEGEEDDAKAMAAFEAAYAGKKPVQQGKR